MQQDVAHVTYLMLHQIETTEREPMFARTACPTSERPSEDFDPYQSHDGDLTISKRLEYLLSGP